MPTSFAAERQSGDCANAARWHFQCITERSRMAWSKASGHNSRAKGEAETGDGTRWLRSRMDECRVTDVKVAVNVLDHMLELGSPAMPASSDKTGIGIVA